MTHLQKEYVTSNTKSVHLSVPEMRMQYYWNMFDNTSPHLIYRERLLEREKYTEKFSSDTKNATSTDPIAWEIVDKKSESHVNLKEREKHVLENVQENLKRPESILLLVENEHEKHAKHITSNISEFCYDDNLLNSANDKVLVIGSNKCQKNIFDEGGSSKSANHVSWKITDEETKLQINQKENEEISVINDNKKENIYEKHEENVLKQNENNDQFDKKGTIEFQCEEKNNVSAKQLTENTKTPTSTYFQSQTEYLLSNVFTCNSSTIQTNSLTKPSDCEKKPCYEIGRQIVDEFDELLMNQKTDLKRSEKQPDATSNPNNLQISSYENLLFRKNAFHKCDQDEIVHSNNPSEKIIFENRAVNSQKGVIKKTVPKPPRSTKVMDNLHGSSNQSLTTADFNPTKIKSLEGSSNQSLTIADFNPAKIKSLEGSSNQSLTTADSNTTKIKSCIKQKIHKKNISDSSVAAKTMHEKRNVSVSENNLSSPPVEFVVDINPKHSTIKNDSDSMHSKRLLMVVGSSLGKTKTESFENRCSSEGESHKHNAMIFGLCAKCVPIQSNKTIGKVRVAKILPNGSFDRSYTNVRHRNKIKFSPKAKTKQLDASKNSAKIIKKKVRFDDDRRIFLYDPEANVLGAFYSYTENKEQNFDDGKTLVSTMTQERVPSELKSTNSNEEIKGTSLNVAEPTIEKKWIKRKDKSMKIKVTHSKIKDKVENNENLTERRQQFYYENFGFIEDSPPSSFSEVDYNDNDSSASFENDEIVFNDKSPLINSKTKSFPRKISHFTSHAECKAKKWFKNAGSLSFKKLSFKKLQAASKK